MCVSVAANPRGLRGGGVLCVQNGDADQRTPFYGACAGYVEITAHAWYAPHNVTGGVSAGEGRVVSRAVYPGEVDLTCLST